MTARLASETAWKVGGEMMRWFVFWSSIACSSNFRALFPVDVLDWFDLLVFLVLVLEEVWSQPVLTFLFSFELLVVSVVSVLR